MSDYLPFIILIYFLLPLVTVVSGIIIRRRLDEQETRERERRRREVER